MILKWCYLRFACWPVEVAAPAVPQHFFSAGSYQVFRPLVIGLVHGLAGSAAVALLVLSTIHTPLWAIAYLLVFGIGTVIGMMLMTSAMAIPVVYTGKHFTTANRYLTPISGIASTAFGLFLLYQIGIVDGLFALTSTDPAIAARFFPQDHPHSKCAISFARAAGLLSGNDRGGVSACVCRTS
jgi:hypothetical protein